MQYWGERNQQRNYCYYPAEKIMMAKSWEVAVKFLELDKFERYLGNRINGDYLKQEGK